MRRAGGGRSADAIGRDAGLHPRGRAMASREEKVQLLRCKMRTYPDFPKPGVTFQDICPILKDPNAFRATIDLFEEHLKENCPLPDLVVGLDARGFLFGPVVAQRLGIGFVPIRKKGKLPGPIISVEFSSEYAKGELEIQCGAVESGQKVVVIDDLLATGGTLSAACELLKKVNAETRECLVVIELKALNGLQKLGCVPCYSILQY
ncbi:adenine phosphoribosyltransferase [Callorhinchus milii]|uniref:Adenine phosphoribosyltransferase n=2 Tax=Callorhinchus milii TaxID=7868 RepID=A0A4W3IVT9_CALMI|nr:adenine phosphoribosyltransferase [Callorhinchus milii]|eukprot:gi/632944434/ref/XP_007887506.1/ PREDICTED: adenine phosphoribosyltransferase [Callorhinchus milii]